MQAAYATGFPLPEPLDKFVSVVAEATCATPDPDEPPPQPAASNAEAAAARTSAAMVARLSLHRLRPDTSCSASG
jgi:hypothetical protein